MYNTKIEKGLDFSVYATKGPLATLFALVSGQGKEIKLESDMRPAAGKGQVSSVALLRKSDGLWDVLEKESRVEAGNSACPTIHENVRLVTAGLTERAARDYIGEMNRTAALLRKEKEAERHNLALAKKILL